MQKVESSSLFIRFRKPRKRGFLVVWKGEAHCFCKRFCKHLRFVGCCAQSRSCGSVGDDLTEPVPYFQAYLWVYSRPGTRSTQGRGFFFLNLTEEQLRDRVVRAWGRGTPITWDGQTGRSTDARIRIWKTDEAVVRVGGSPPATGEIAEVGEEVTNDWILGPAGFEGSVEHGRGPLPTNGAIVRNSRRVMVVHGAGHQARDAMFIFLRSLGS